ncbi:hypothetical protein HGRIS_011432 [Hohenbuehelia grisea]|uniref:Proteophosphoglycan ppg4 n=1 Tax=Hohenbuehelia grisea TaxID=104357 RepID=A0ABR3JX97_9AGAR
MIPRTSVPTMAAAQRHYPRAISVRSHSVGSAEAPVCGPESGGCFHSSTHDHSSSGFPDQHQQTDEDDYTPPRPMSRLGFFEDDDGDDADISADEFDALSEAGDFDSDFEDEVEHCDRLPAPSIPQDAVVMTSDFCPRHSSSSSAPTASPIYYPTAHLPLSSLSSTCSATSVVEHALPTPYSCLPSPLHELDQPPSTPQTEAPHDSTASRHPARHDYLNHGRSRNALTHFKWFWSVREEGWDWAWEDESSDEEDADADGDTLSFKFKPRPRLTESGKAQAIPQTPKSPAKRSSPTTKRKTRFPPLSVHPRRGALAGLRDPYSAQIDRCLGHVPLWTLSKALWMFDVQVGVARMAAGSESAPQSHAQKAKAGKEPEQWEDDEEKEVSRMRAPSVTSAGSDDSDVTLVDSDEEDAEVAKEDETGGADACDEVLDELLDTDGDLDYLMPDTACSPSSSKTPNSAEPSSSKQVILKTKAPDFEPTRDFDLLPKASLALQKLAQPQAPYTYAPPHRARQWTTDWYTRWAILVEATRWEREQSTLRVACADALLAALAVPPAIEPGLDEISLTVARMGEASGRGRALVPSAKGEDVGFGLTAVEREGDLSTLCAFAFARDTVVAAACPPATSPSPSSPPVCPVPSSTASSQVANTPAIEAPRKRFFFASADLDEGSASEDESSGGEEDVDDSFGFGDVVPALVQ